MRACRYAGYPMIEIPIFSTERFGGRSTTSYKSAVRMLSGAYRLRGSLAGSPLPETGPRGAPVVGVRGIERTTG